MSALRRRLLEEIDAASGKLVPKRGDVIAFADREALNAIEESPVLPRAPVFILTAE